MSTTDKKPFERLYALQQSDEGMFVLAVHSFVESFIRRNIKDLDVSLPETNFYVLINAFYEHLRAEADGKYIRYLDVLNNLNKYHKQTNEVRHRFAVLDKEDVRIATQHLNRFCMLSGINTDEDFSCLLKALAVWDERRPYHELVRDNKKLELINDKLSRDHKRITEELTALHELKEEQDHLNFELEQAKRSLDKEKKRSGDRSEKIDQLRQEHARLRNELKEKTREIAQYKETEESVSVFNKQLMLARTRLDYEQMILRLSSEQQAVLSQIGLDSDFLIKGSAGTGKTLVLLKAVEKAKGRGLGGANVQDELEMQELRGSIALLTYTTTLVKYDQWLSTLMMNDVISDDDRICTVDAFLLTALEQVIPGAKVLFDNTFLEKLAEVFCEACELSAKDLAVEAEEFIWSGHVTKEEYIDEVIARSGRKTQLTKEKRIPVWDAVCAMRKEMAQQKTFSRCAAACEILDAGNAAQVDYLFVDEVQDLPAVILKCCRVLTRRSVILAGDADQSIYQNGFSFKRAGLDIAGHTRILKSNYRNTGPIHELAEKYRLRSDYDAETAAIAWRRGTDPVHLYAEESAALLDLLAERISLFINTLGYEAHNLCILCINKKSMDSIQRKLMEKNIASKNIKDPDFDFSSNGEVRLSTLHSAKGLDFPLVFLYLNREPFCGILSEEEADKRIRNLIYVSLTRAMEHIDVFTKKEPSHKAIQDLVELLQGDHD